jgi:hypothetical protein
MSRDDFFEALERKVDQATEGWPAWKHEVLRNSFRSTNSTPRPVIVVKKESVPLEDLQMRGKQQDD